MHCTAIFHTSEYAKFAVHVQLNLKMSGEEPYPIKCPARRLKCLSRLKTISHTLHTSKYCSLIIFVPISVKWGKGAIELKADRPLHGADHKCPRLLTNIHRSWTLFHVSWCFCCTQKSNGSTMNVLTVEQTDRQDATKHIISLLHVDNYPSYAFKRKKAINTGVWTRPEHDNQGWHIGIGRYGISADMEYRPI